MRATNKITTITISRELHSKISKIAKREHRSFSAQVTIFLREAVGQRATVCHKEAAQ